MTRACLLLVFLVAGASHAQEQAEAADPVEVIADLAENSLSAEEIRSISRVGGMRGVSLEEFAGADLQRLQETLRETEDGFGEVQTAIESNEAFEAAIREAEVDLYSVVAITRDESGGFTAYTNAPTP